MKKTGRYGIFIILLFTAEDILLLNILYLVLLNIFDFDYDDMSYLLLQTVVNLGYILSIAATKFDIDVRRLLVRHIMQANTYRLFITAVIVLLCLFVAKTSETVSRLFTLTFFVSAFAILTVTHYATRKVLTYAMVRNHNGTIKAIILGAGFIGKKIHDELKNNIYLGIKVLGFFDDNPLRKEEVLGTVEQAKEFAKANNVTKIYCTLPLSDHRVTDILNFAELNVINFHIAPPIEYYYTNNPVVESVGNILVFTTQKTPLDNFHNIILKRVFDLVVSFLFLITLFPIIYIIVGIAIKLSSRGPVFFIQERTGKNGATFNCYKFRSMRCNSEANIRQATANDSRKTRVGDFLRKTNIDELPQFINVLKGEMSIIGPRPHMLLHTEEYSRLVNKYMVRHFIKPGVTGWAQINGCRGETKEVSQMEERIRKDIWYLENWSFMLDLEILIRTVAATIKGDKKAY
jgi:putative colanic acid biosynthesis UDP-glucose lipid carrier transferase